MKFCYIVIFIENDKIGIMFLDERMKIFVVIGNKLGVLVFKDFVILWVKGKNNIGYYYLVIVN